LCRRFRRLFVLDENKSFKVATVHELGWEEGGICWRWTRRLWAWEEELLKECRALLYDASLQHNVSDHWQWRPDPSKGYSVRGVYRLLTTHDVHNTVVTTDLLWHKQVPLKVFIMTWRLLRNRLLTKDNLVVCGIIPC